jgi:hypothetical protein
VSKKATITINGEIAKLADLMRGHIAKVAYNKDLEVVSKIEATGSPAAASFVVANELEGMYPSLTKDGLTIVYESNGAIWVARRDRHDAYFSDMKLLFPGRHPAISSDGLEIIFHHKAAGKEQPTLHSAKRDRVDETFRRAAEIQELATVVDPKSPILSPDGLTLCFRMTGANAMVAYSVRSDLSGKWSKPQMLISPAAEAKAGGYFTWTWISQDKLSLLAALEGDSSEGKNLYVLTRKKDSSPFTEFRLISDEVIPERIRCPRFVLETGELFVTGSPKTPSPFSIGIIKNFSFPQ